MPDAPPAVQDVDAALQQLTAALRRDLAAASASIERELAELLDRWPGQVRPVRLAQLRELQANVGRLMRSSRTLARDAIPGAVAGAYQLGGSSTAVAVQRAATYAAIDRASVAALAQDSYRSLLEATEHMEETTKDVVRRLARDHSRDRLLLGRTAQQAARRLAADLEGQGISAIVYRNGANHTLADYSDMVLRTKTAEAFQAGGLAQGKALGIGWWEIMDNPECGLDGHDDPTKANGQIVRTETAERFVISHPRCVRVTTARPDIASLEDARSAGRGLQQPRQVADQQLVAMGREEAAAARAGRSAAALRNRAIGTRLEERFERLPGGQLIPDADAAVSRAAKSRASKQAAVQAPGSAASRSRAAKVAARAPEPAPAPPPTGTVGDIAQVLDAARDLTGDAREDALAIFARSIGETLEDALPFNSLRVRNPFAREYDFYGGRGVRVVASATDERGNVVINLERRFWRDEEGRLQVSHELLEIKPDYQGMGIATDFNRAMEAGYRAQGVDSIVVHANIDVGGYTWARAGFDWDLEAVGGPDGAQRTALQLLDHIGLAAKLERVDVEAELRRLRALLEGDDREAWPTPFDLARIGYTDGAESWPGKRGMLDSNWHGRKRLVPPEEIPAVELPPSLPRVLAGDEALASLPDLTSSLSALEDQALHFYQGSGFARLNGALRYDALEERNSISGKLVNADVIEVLPGLDSLVARSVLDEPIEVWRGIRNPTELLGDPGSSVGRTFTDRGFASTSIDRGVAEEFADKTLELVYESAVMRIHLPAGARAIRTPDFGNEREVLVARGARFRVTGDRIEVDAMQKQGLWDELVERAPRRRPPWSPEKLLEEARARGIVKDRRVIDVELEVDRPAPLPKASAADEDLLRGDLGKLSVDELDELAQRRPDIWSDPDLAPRFEAAMDAAELREVDVAQAITKAFRDRSAVEQRAVQAWYDDLARNDAEAARIAGEARDLLPAAHSDVATAALREEYDLWQHTAWLRAEEATNGYMLAREAVARGIDPRALWSGNPVTAVRHMSEELRRYFADHPEERMTYTEFRAMRRPGLRLAGRRSREAFARALLHHQDLSRAPAARRRAPRIRNAGDELAAEQRRAARARAAERAALGENG